MGYVDIGVIIIVLILGIRGLKNGLIHEIMGAIGVVLGIYLASRYCVEVGHYIELAGLEFQNQTILWTFGFIVVLSVVWIGFLVLGAFVARFVVMPELAIVNYFGGYVFAALKYFVILCLVVYALSQIGFLKQPIKDFTKEAKSYPMMLEIAQKIMSLEALEEIQKQYDDKKQAISNHIENAKSKITEKVNNSLRK